MEPVQAPAFKPSLDRPPAESGGQKLMPSEHSMLASRKCRELSFALDAGAPPAFRPGLVSFTTHVGVKLMNPWVRPQTCGGLHRGAGLSGALLDSGAMANDTISFARGAPSADILPRDAVRDAAATALANDWEKALSYGTGTGHPGLCEWVAARHGGLDVGQVMIANGSLEAGAMLFEHLLEPGDRVVVEQPTYDRTLLMLQRLGVELVPVPLEADGLDIAALESALAEGPIKLAHVIPNFHNPAGCTLSAEKRVRLVELAAAHDFWIFEDDPYRELPFEGEALETMLSLDKADRVIHASSFSKTVSPGVRVGYLAGPAAQIGKLAKRANEIYISPNMLAEAVVLELCSSGGLDRNIEFVKGALRARRDALVEALNEQIPEAEFVVPGGGYFLWLDLAAGTDTPTLLAEAKGEGVGFVAGPDFMIEGGGNSLRLSFASVPPERISEGVSRIARALERVRAGSPA
jgi:DNA-binding transcriptional MocR family regulator